MRILFRSATFRFYAFSMQLRCSMSWRCALRNRVSLYLVPTVAQIRYFTKILAGGRCPPDPPIFGWGGKAPPDSPLNGRSSHLIEAAKRGRLDQMIFFSGAADDTVTRAPPGRPAGHPAERPAGRPLTTRAPPTTVRRPDQPGI